MSRNKRGIYIGTSGWNYKHWIGTFYPAGTKDNQQLDHYLTVFNTVELNSSFYHLPAPKTFERWADQVPEGFIFSIKGSRYITHMKKLNVGREAVLKFFAGANILGSHLGPVLFQLPPRWNLNVERLSYFLQLLPAGNRYVFEFRNPSWYDQEVYECLRKANCAFCIYELAGHRSPFITTADFVYVRLHGPGNKYEGSYTPETLAQWAKQIRVWHKAGMDVYVYFDNDQKGYAPFNAGELINLLE